MAFCFFLLSALVTLGCFIFALLKCMLSRFNGSDADYFSDKDYRRPSPSLVPLPIDFPVDSIKDRLPLVQHKGSGKNLCCVCLRSVRFGDEIRELSVCCHVFHRECIDGWIDQGRSTCPVCRGKLLDDDGGERLLKKLNDGDGGRGGDPWRRERMIYLFGEDCFF